MKNVALILTVLLSACVQAAWYWPFPSAEDNTNKPPRLHRLLEKANDFIELAEDESVAGFGDGGEAIPSTRFIRLAMEYGKMTGKRFFFQPMDKSLRKHGCVHEGAYSDMLGMKGIPRIAETIFFRRTASVSEESISSKLAFAW